MSKEKISLATKFRNVRGEFRKIIWPNRNELTKSVITVIGTSLLIGLIVTGMDFIFNNLVQTIINFLIG